MLNTVFQRVRRGFFSKLLLGGGVPAVYGVMYFLLQRAHLGTPRVQPACPVSALLPFEPRWTPLYLSMFVMVGAVWLPLPGGARATPGRSALMLLGMGAVAAFVSGSTAFLMDKTRE
jgi:hypothetical protein